jgi:uncharacterized membrane protein
MGRGFGRCGKFTGRPAGAAQPTPRPDANPFPCDRHCLSVSPIMPYQWLPPQGEIRHLRLWPHRSLPRVGFVWFIGGTAGLIALPLAALIGSPVLWGMLPFVVLAVAAIWWALMRSYHDGAIIEALTLTPDHTRLTRDGPRGLRREWQANTHWVQVTLHPKGGPVPNYLTLRGGPREVEIGRFLSEDERISLARTLTEALVQVRAVRPGG